VCPYSRCMINQPNTSERVRRENAVTQTFLQSPNGDTFTTLFHTFFPQLVAFFRARRCEPSLAEDLAQEVMLTVYCKASQIRDRSLFRGWLFKIARNTLCRHYGKQTREVEIVDLGVETEGLAAPNAHKDAGTPAFEFLRWMDFLDSPEREVMKLRFIEQWEYHEIASAKAIPIGTVQWRVFNAKKKLALHLTASPNLLSKAA
jgi:RNA polymerase sigma-70 factor (ECF subfamily)